MERTTIERAFTDQRLLGAALGDPATWLAWRSVLKASYAEPLRKWGGFTLIAFSEWQNELRQYSGSRALALRMQREQPAVGSDSNPCEHLPDIISVFGCNEF
jgi:hypothetical protein